MAGGRVGADGGADVGDSPSMHPGRHGRWDSEGVLGVVVDGREFVWLGYPIRRWRDVSYSEPHRRFWRQRLGCARYFDGEPLPPPRAEDRIPIFAGTRWVVRVSGDHCKFEPEVPEPFRRTEVQEVSHRVWQDYGTDGTRRWPRWWCSCGAHGQGWPANHGDSR
jgi:hypothetical protein